MSMPLGVTNRFMSHFVHLLRHLTAISKLFLRSVALHERCLCHTSIEFVRSIWLHLQPSAVSCG